jgi:short-subunit dehydrogenase
MKTVVNKVVLITGGAMGVGKKLAEQSVRAGARVVLWDVNEKALQETAKELSAQGGEIHTYLVDVSDVTAIETNAQRVLRDVGTVDILFNNAGIVFGTAFINHTVEQIERTMRINTLGVMHVARVFLPGMIRKGEGNIVNMASAAGYIGNPNMSVYAASKWAVIGWSESLRLEMKKNGLHNIQVTTVTPSYIDTGMFTGVKAPLLTPILKPEVITKAIWQGMLRGKAFVRAPIIVNLLVILKRILPVQVFDFVVGDLFRVYTSMDTFKGHRGRHAH